MSTGEAIADYAESLLGEPLQPWQRRALESPGPQVLISRELYKADKRAYEQLMEALRIEAEEALRPQRELAQRVAGWGRQGLL